MLGLACLTVLLLLSLLQQPTAVAARADLPSQAVKPTFIAIGDGLTEGAFNHKYDGWGLLMQERYVRKVRASVCAHKLGATDPNAPPKNQCSLSSNSSKMHRFSYAYEEEPLIHPQPPHTYRLML